eukprot:5043941-Ditylum_brightwellii.AAC.2
MSFVEKQVKWQYVIINLQDREALSSLHHKIEGYKTVELYQWELNIQFFARGTTSTIPTAEVGNKVKHLLLKLHEADRKKNFTAFREKEQ